MGAKGSRRPDGSYPVREGSDGARGSGGTAETSEPGYDAGEGYGRIASVGGVTFTESCLKGATCLAWGTTAIWLVAGPTVPSDRTPNATAVASFQQPTPNPLVVAPLISVLFCRARRCGSGDLHVLRCCISNEIKHGLRDNTPFVYFGTSHFEP